MRSLSSIAIRRSSWLVAVVLNAGLALASLVLWAIAYTHRLTLGADFTAFYTGWSLVVNGLGHRLYDYHLQTVVQQQLLGGQHLAGGLLPFNYPPHVALLFAPLAYLSLARAYLVWSVLQLSVLMWLAEVLWKHLKEEGVSAQNRFLFISAVAALPAVLATLYLGAFSIFMLLCSLNFALALRQNDDLRAGLWVVFLSLKPQVAVVPALVLVATRRWKAIAVAAGGGLIMVIVTTLAFGTGVWLNFAGVLNTTYGADSSLGVSPSAMGNLRGILTFVLGDRSTDLVNWISLFAFIATSIFILWLWSSSQGSAHDFDIRMAVALLTGILFSLHANPHDGVLVVAPVLFFWHHLRRTGRGNWTLAALAVVCPPVAWVAERGLQTPWAARLPSTATVLLGVWMSHAYFAANNRGSELTSKSTQCERGQPWR